MRNTVATLPNAVWTAGNEHTMGDLIRCRNGGAASRGVPLEESGAGLERTQRFGQVAMDQETFLALLR